ncbi:MAG: hypothetical protein A4E65_00782 [Syntrophorhabdus sp. PtaU1.Bin153]|nr:MAG: hypothetical protein A4E65_00782 [Syntrophorhabdus sp. PtaU1.Bin153]
MIGKIRPRTKPNPGSMGSLEKQYAAEVLKPRKITGEIVDYRFEAIKLRLAPNTFYTPDFVVTFEDRIELHETKGYWEDDARAKIKIAAAMFPEFVFIGVEHKKRKEEKKIRGAKKYWFYEEFKAA